ncbi:MAG: helix-hairpin-helix domain-containing protein [Clostridiales bacterium]|nr:helix-hairpin-helix domain-containing protein [Clostridiales bacterium]
MTKEAWQKQHRYKEYKDLKTIPGVGKDMEQHFFDAGIHTIDNLKGANPEELYEKACIIKGSNIDKCVLYVFRLAVYYANNEVHEPEKLKWWYWKDKNTYDYI